MKHHLLLFFIACSLLSFITKQEDDDIISWDENKPLTWADFKGLPQKTKATAFTGSKILRSIAKSTGNTASVKIQTVFFCKQSWKKKQDTGNAALLHEQKHFDIAELYARKLRSMIKTQKYNSLVELRKKSDSLSTFIDKELTLYQAKYDDKTNFGRNNKQRSWNLKIKAALDSLNDQSPPVFIILLH